MTRARQIVDKLLETCAGARAKEANYREITRKLEAVRKRPALGANYAQLLLKPFGPVPSYAQEDPACDWWAGEEAEQLKAELTELLAPNSQHGVKPSPPQRPPSPSSKEWPPFDHSRIDPKWKGEMD